MKLAIRMAALRYLDREFHNSRINVPFTITSERFHK